jgi:hypothetical protein
LMWASARGPSCPVAMHRKAHMQVNRKEAGGPEHRPPPHHRQCPAPPYTCLLPRLPPPQPPTTLGGISMPLGKLERALPSQAATSGQASTSSAALARQPVATLA